MKTLITLSLLTLSATLSASEFKCVAQNEIEYSQGQMKEVPLKNKTDWQTTKFIIDEATRQITDGDSVYAQMKGTESDCPVYGNGGELYWSGNGPDTYGFRLPTAALQGAKSFILNFFYDNDSDGMACSGAKYVCTFVKY